MFLYTFVRKNSFIFHSILDEVLGTGEHATELYVIILRGEQAEPVTTQFAKIG